MRIVIIGLLILSLLGCAANQEVVKPKSDMGAKAHPSQALQRTLKISHYITFRSDPLGAEILVIDSTTGKEVQSFGKTPVRILLMTKTIQYDPAAQRILNVSNTAANTVGLSYGKESVEGAEFQFKFRLAGYYDEMMISRIPLTAWDSDSTINAVLKLLKEKMFEIGTKMEK